MENLIEETLSSSYLYRGRIVNVRQDRVSLPNGKTAFREVVEHPGAVAVLALDEQARAILVRQYRQAAGSVLLEIPAGKLDPGESATQCARRELAEETGLQGGSWRELGCFYLSPGYCNEKITLFRVTGLSEAPPTAGDEDEKIEVFRMPLADILDLIKNGEIKDAKTVLAVTLSAALTA